MKKIKIAVISIYDNNNYGNRLQSYALVSYLNQQKTVCAWSIQPVFTNRLWLHTCKQEAAFIKNRMLRRLGRKSPDTSRLLNFMLFSKLIPTKRYSCKEPYLLPESLNAKFDRFVIGSDQVWNLNWVTPESSYFKAFTLQFLPHSSYKYAYAASIGTDEVAKDSILSLCMQLHSFRGVSVRESFSQAMLKKHGVETVYTCIDPVFLFSKDQWEDRLKKRSTEIPSGCYVLLYFLGGITDGVLERVQRMANGSEIHIIDLLDKSTPYYEYGPDGFVKLISHAAHIFTDSFHAVAFSIIYEKAFTVFDRDCGETPMGGRIPDLLGRLDLLEYAYDKEKLSLDVKPDYHRAYCLLNEEIRKSKCFISEMCRKNES